MRVLFYEYPLTLRDFYFGGERIESCHLNSPNHQRRKGTMKKKLKVQRSDQEFSWVSPQEHVGSFLLLSVGEFHQCNFDPSLKNTDVLASLPIIFFACEITDVFK